MSKPPATRSNGKGPEPGRVPVERKGEIGELRAQLRDPALERDPIRRRETLKHVISLMTLGIDTSALFTEMILACATKDLVQKKMVYFYLCSYAEQNSEIALLAINTLQKDCRDESPLVRGLALRAMSSLRLPSVVEYLSPILKAAFTDVSPYVRKTAIVASIKLYRSSPSTFEGMNLEDKLYGLIADHDGIVCCNALMALREVLRHQDKGDIVLTKKIVYTLLNRMRDLNEWQFCLVLNVCLPYVPENEDEMFDIMNMLEERLRGNNSAVIMASAHFFLNITQNVPLVHRQVYDRLREPLLTILATAAAEPAYACLCHIKLLAQREPSVFSSHFRDFYCRYTDPPYIKSLKLDVLAVIVTEINAKEIFAELVAYTQDVQVEVVKKAIKTIAHVGLKLESTAKLVVDCFLDFLSDSNEIIQSQTFIALRSFLCKYTQPETVAPFFRALIKAYDENTIIFDDPETKNAFIWIMGEFGEQIDEAPYTLESFIGSFLNEPAMVRLEVLTAAMKLFFKKPGEMQHVLGRLLETAVNDFSHADVHDRALMYYRLLTRDVALAHRMVSVKRENVAAHGMEGVPSMEVLDKLFEEFNSLSVILERPSNRFLSRVEETNDADEEVEEDEEEGDGEEDNDEEEADDEKQLLNESAAAAIPPSSTKSVHEPNTSSMPPLELDADAEMDLKVFQSCWAAWKVLKNINAKVSPAGGEDALEEVLEDAHILCLATGKSGNSLRAFYFCTLVWDEEEEDQEEGTDGHPTKPTVLIELVMDSFGMITGTLKTNATPAILERVTGMVVSALAKLA